MRTIVAFLFVATLGAQPQIELHEKKLAQNPDNLAERGVLLRLYGGCHRWPRSTASSHSLVDRASSRRTGPRRSGRDHRDGNTWIFDRDKSLRVIPTRETSVALDLIDVSSGRWRVYAVPRAGAPGKTSDWKSFP